MEIENVTFMEVENDPHIWAILLEHCKESMKPVFPLFINVCNQVGEDILVIDNTLTDTKPTKMIDGVDGCCIADDYIHLGFWRINYKSA